MIADVVFDVPLERAFTYAVPAGWTLAPGQRVLAPLHGASRAGMVVAVRDDDATGTPASRRPGALKPLLRLLDPHPVFSVAQLELADWIAAQSLSSLGSTCAALAPPAVPGRSGHDGAAETAGAGTPERGAAPAHGATDGAGRFAHGVAPPEPALAHGAVPGGAQAAVPADAQAVGAAAGSCRGDLLAGAGRERRLLDRLAGAPGMALVITPDVEGCARWAQRLERAGRVARLDSGVSDLDRARAWAALARGQVRLAVGTRAALLAPLAAGATLALLDEHEAAHKPPGPPRMHARDVVLERADREALQAVLTAATPSVESWWRAESAGALRLEIPPPGPWPAVSVTDTRGILRREALTPEVARAVRETLGQRRRVFLAVSRMTSSLACDECGAVCRCHACGIALACARSAASVACRLCGATAPLPDTCPGCGGHRLSPFGWGIERVEHAVRRRFPGARVARYDPDATRGARGEAQRSAAGAADVVIGTRGALRLFGPGSLGLAAFISPDHLLRQPDFRAAERAFALVWAAAERVEAGGRVILQSQHPTHYAFEAVARQDLGAFYRPELRFRAELGYPPFRRLALITLRATSAAAADRAAAEVAAALGASPRLVVYPPAPGRPAERVRRVVVKGHADLAEALRDALGGLPVRPRTARGRMDVEVDPVEWPS